MAQFCETRETGEDAIVIFAEVGLLAQNTLESSFSDVSWIVKYLDAIDKVMRPFLEAWLSRLPVVGIYANKIAVELVQCGRLITGLSMQMFVKVLRNPEWWKKMHIVAMKAFANEEGTIKGCLAYSQAVVVYFWQTIKKIIDKVMDIKGIKMSENDLLELDAMISSHMEDHMPQISTEMVSIQ